VGTNYAQTDLAPRLAAFAGIGKKADEELLAVANEVRHALAVYFATQPAIGPVAASEPFALADLVDELVVFDHGVHLLAEDHRAAAIAGCDPADYIARCGGSPLDPDQRSTRARLGLTSSDDQVRSAFHARCGARAGERSGGRLKSLVTIDESGTACIRWRGALGLLDELMAWSANDAYVTAFLQAATPQVLDRLEQLLAAGHPFAESDPHRARREARQVTRPIELLRAVD
jgi:hypothetical protein